MIYRELGGTNLRVSAIALGTVALGTPYGVGDGDSRQPPRDLAIGLLQHAAANRITLFDTALGDDDACVIATKITVARNWTGTELRRTLEAALETRRRNLRRDVIDLLRHGVLGFRQFKPSFAHTSGNVKRYAGAVSQVFGELAKRDLASLLSSPPAHTGFARLTRE